MALVSQLQSKYHSKIYLNFVEIEENDFHEIIRFYEDNEAEIKRLDFEEFFELLVIYVNALFETGAYRKHLVLIDTVIENSILRNIQYFKGEDIYRTTLFRKAASLYNLKEYNKADYILRELIKIDPFDKGPILFLKKCLRKNKSSLLRFTNAFSIFLFLLAAAIIAVEILVIRPFYEDYVTVFKNARIISFVLGCLVFGLGNLVHRSRIDKEVNAFVEAIKSQKLK